MEELYFTAGPKMIRMSREDFDQLIEDIFRHVEASMKQVEDRYLRCPKCNGPIVEIFNTERPFVGLTGIYRCLVDECDHTFDPTLPEVR
jgi:hypothetical protein